MTKLHELLAVEGDLKGQAQRVLGEVKDLFQGGISKFLGQIETHQPASENDEQLPPKITHVATTVAHQLGILEKAFVSWIDVSIQKEHTNQAAGAHLEIGEEVYDLSATALLNLESKLAELRSAYRAIPTNDVTTPWKWDSDNGVFVSDPPTIRRTTKKEMKSFVAVPATEHHPAQVEIYAEDVLSGHKTIVTQSGMITPTDKQGRLDRLESLLQEVRKARQRANDIETDSTKIGRAIFAYINGE